MLVCSTSHGNIALVFPEITLSRLFTEWNYAFSMLRGQFCHNSSYMLQLYFLSNHVSHFKSVPVASLSKVWGVLFISCLDVDMLQSMVLKWFGNLRECCFTLWHGEHSDSCCLSSKPQQGTDSIPPQPKLTLQAWVQLHSFPLSLNSCSLSLDWLPFSVEDRWKFLEHVIVRVKLTLLSLS